MEGEEPCSGGGERGGTQRGSGKQAFVGSDRAAESWLVAPFFIVQASSDSPSAPGAVAVQLQGCIVCPSPARSS